MWDVTENLLYLQQFEGLFSAVFLQVSANAENVLWVTTYEMVLMKNWFLLIAMSPSDMGRMHLSDDFSQLVPY